MGTAFDAIVLCGGGARRMGGGDKTRLLVGGESLFETAVRAAHEAGARRTVAVGPERPASFPVLFVREDPPGGGPVAAIAEGLRHVREEIVVILAADMPLITSREVRSLIREMNDDGAVLVDEDGVLQPLAAAYRRDALQAAIDALETPQDQSLRRVVGRLRLTRVGAGAAALDCDTPQDLEAARRARG